MSAFTSSHRNFALPSFVLLALAAFTMTVCAIEQSETIHRRLATTLADAPSLRLHFTLKRSSMNLYGQSQFYVFANPVVSSDNTSVIYDGYATFLDGTTEYTYMLVNGIAYSVVSTVGNASSLTAQCLPSILLPPVNNIISALSNATTVSSAFAGNDTITCASGILLQATLGDTTFDLDITVDYLTSPATITAPNLSDEAALSCETFVTPSPVSQTALTLLTGQAIPSSFRRNLKAASTTTLASSSCGCKSTPRPCVFFHGLGGKSEATTLQTKSRYFGDLSKNAPCCSCAILLFP
ncbi:hypothetical protein Plhal703r1_c11g0056901 [Plasmopara halstedii]